jgi:DNA-binding transcriptional ArsR family regulator
MARTRAELMRVAMMFKAACNPTAVEVLFTLAGGERIAGDLAKDSRMSHFGGARILVMLRLTGLVARRRDGQRVFYSLTDLGRDVLTVAKLGVGRK